MNGVTRRRFDFLIAFGLVMASGHADAQQCRGVLRERGIDATICTGVEGLQVYELD